MKAPFESLLACPDCRTAARMEGENTRCETCGREFESTDGVLVMMPSEPRVDTRGADNPHCQKWKSVAAESLDEYFELGNGVFRWIHHSAHKRVAQYPPSPEAWTLDLGCGGGAHFSYFSERESVVGVDVNLDSLRSARRRFPRARVMQADACRLPFRDGAFGTIISIYSLEHLFFLGDVLAEVRRVLADDGLFLVGLPCEGGWAWNLGRRFTSQRTLSKRYGLDYAQAIAIEHCNSARGVVRELRRSFQVERRRFFPFGWIPSVDLNLTLTLAARKSGQKAS
ncbi:methyltransferase domain-containing protein [Candidatus Sumerlaeota bacterium]|nr:methyltransferase domain-containing protein [Candidatus Sumerlaeota bacterium]